MWGVAVPGSGGGGHPRRRRSLLAVPYQPRQRRTAATGRSPGLRALADITSSDGRPLAAVVGYRVWGWPVTLRGDGVWLSLERDAVALVVPVPLAEQVTAILHQRRCPPLVLVHPDTPAHRMLLAGEPYGVGLPWPTGVYRASGAVSLPPTKTARGPVSWVSPPEADALRLCREVDVFGALHTALRGPPR